MHVSDVGGGGGATVRLVVARRGRPARRLLALPVWVRGEATLVYHVVDHLLDLFKARLEAVLRQKTAIKYTILMPNRPPHE